MTATTRTTVEATFDGCPEYMDPEEGVGLDVTIQVEPSDETECIHCHENIVEYEGVWHHDKGTRGSINDPTYCDALSADDEEYEGEFSRATPLPQGMAGSVNWVGCTVGDDYAEAQISVGDPRGCFAMRVWRGEGPDGTPRLYLSLPHLNESAPHVELVKHTEGTFIIKGAS